MKTVRIYRARTEGEFKVNTYFQYFDSMKEAKKSPSRDRWHCTKVRYEKFDAEKNKWIPA